MAKQFVRTFTFPIDKINENFIDNIYKMAMDNLDHEKVKASQSYSVSVTTLSTENLSVESMEKLKNDIDIIKDAIENMKVSGIYIIGNSNEIVDKIMGYSKDKVEILQEPEKDNPEYQYTVTYKSVKFTIYTSYCGYNVQDVFISVYIDNEKGECR